jgi:hypothetical protein
MATPFSKRNPADELVHFTVALPEEIVAEIDHALEASPVVRNRERFIAFALLFALADIHRDAAAGLDRF